MGGILWKMRLRQTCPPQQAKMVMLTMMCLKSFKNAVPHFYPSPLVASKPGVDLTPSCTNYLLLPNPLLNCMSYL